MRSAICDTLPEPNRRLLQRILMMMQTVVSHKIENRMSTPAVAACMAPLLLRPLLDGECEIESDFEMGNDGSVQLIQAAAAANHAQAIVITLLEEYDKLFAEGSVLPELYSDSDYSGSGSEELTDDDESYEDDSQEGSDADTGDDICRKSSATTSEVGEYEDSNKSCQVSKSGSKIREADSEASRSMPRSPPHNCIPLEGSKSFLVQYSRTDCGEQLGPELAKTSTSQKLTDVQCSRRPALWGRSPAKKNLSMESINVPLDDVTEIQRLEVTKTDLQFQIAEQAKGNALLQESLENRKNALHEHRLSLEKDVAQLEEQLEKEMKLRKLLEAGVNMSLVEEVDEAEGEIINLKERYNSLEESCTHVSDQPQQCQDKDDKHKDVKTSATSQNFDNSTRDEEHQTPLQNDIEREKDTPDKLQASQSQTSDKVGS
ncbi:hypothetical protein AABB24_032739 [Solanum stoloniferum]|uniref:Rho-GAP domain-containing protein n=1 Tax=Solanum stoloniferum TaxID=62892 RepID=A0ABD2RLN3_9SOLN